MFHEHKVFVLKITACFMTMQHISLTYSVFRENDSICHEKDMFHEIKIARLLYSFGISVPEPIICDFVNVRDIVEIGYIMEYIDGITNEPSTRQQANDEVNKAVKLGFSRVKNIDGNYVDNPEWIFTKDKKIKLIDFTKWQYKDIICQY